MVLWFWFVISEYGGCLVQCLTGFDCSSGSGHLFCQLRDPSHASLDSIQGLVHLVVDFFVGGLGKRRCFGGQGEVRFFLSSVEVEIVEI